MTQPEPLLKTARLRARRQQLGLTQEELAEQSGVNQSTISQLERGVQSPTVHSLIGLSKALHVSIEWLLGLQDDTDSKVIDSNLSEIESELLTLSRRIYPAGKVHLLNVVREIIAIQR